jgi:ribosomal protein L11 methyltransferase
LELAPGGVEEVTLADGSVEYAVYGAPGELPTLPALSALAGEALVEVSSRTVADDWQERWREFHRPLVIGTRLGVRPPWAPAARTELDVVIDPGQAFGTGAHPTTRLCLEMLLGLQERGGLVDLGCGSGVLAITAAKLGFAPVGALDHDPAALAATRANAAANHVELEVERLDLRADPLPAAPTLVANLLGPLLITLADRLGEGGRPERLIAGGMLGGEADGVAGAFARIGLSERARRHRGEWAALLLALPSLTDAHRNH